MNNGNKYHPYKNVIKKHYLEFLDEENNKDRIRDDGIYTSYYIGED